MVVSELYPEAMTDPPGMGYFVLKNQDSGICPILLSVAHHFSPSAYPSWRTRRSRNCLANGMKTKAASSIRPAKKR